jgi:integrase
LHGLQLIRASIYFGGTHALFETGYNYGWRIGELLRLRVRQIDVVSRTIRLNPGETKNDEGRIIVMTDTVHKLLSQCVIGKVSEHRVFTRPNGRPVVDLRATWSAICKEAGVPV